MDIADFVELQIMEKSSKETIEEKNERFASINAKRNLLGNYHKIKRKFFKLSQGINKQTKSKIFWR